MVKKQKNKTISSPSLLIVYRVRGISGRKKKEKGVRGVYNSFLSLPTPCLFFQEAENCGWVSQKKKNSDFSEEWLNELIYKTKLRTLKDNVILL